MHDCALQELHDCMYMYSLIKRLILEILDFLCNSISMPYNNIIITQLKHFHPVQEIWKVHMTEVQLDTVNKKSKPMVNKS